MSGIIERFRAAMADAGVVYSGDIQANTGLQRVKGDKHKNGKNIAYKLSVDGKGAGGFFQDWTSETSGTWTDKGGSYRMTKADYAAIDAEKKARAAELDEQYKAAAVRANKAWEAGNRVESHPYCVAKNVSIHGARVNDKNELMIPVYNRDGDIQSLQCIAAKPDKDGRWFKKNFTDAKMGGGFWWIGSVTDIIIICEGFATAATLHAVYGYRVVIAFGCHNLAAVAVDAVRYKYPNAKIIVAGDNNANGVGQKCANAAADACGGTVLIPDREGYDWNDHYNDLPVDVAVEPEPVEPVIEYSDDWQGELARLVDEWNKTHASVMIGGKHRIMRHIPQQVQVDDRQSMEFIAHKDMLLIHQNTSIQVGWKEAAIPSALMKSHYLAWVSHKKCRTYKSGVVFKPGAELPPGYLNTWVGYSVTPSPGASWEFIQHHIDHVICAGDKLLSEYFYNWVAYTFQNPDKPAGAAVVLRGKKGVGKGSIVQFLMSIWGAHAMQVTSPKYLTGNFNIHLHSICLLFCDEAFFSGDKGSEGVLKGLITEKHRIQEGKGLDAKPVPNYLKIIMATNHDYAVPASSDERRYCVCDVSDEFIGDTSYFHDLRRDCENTAIQSAFLHAMLSRDISDFHTGKIPDTQGLRDQRLHSLCSVGKWLVDCINAESFAISRGDDSGWDTMPRCKELYHSYLFWCDNNKITEFGRKTETAFGIYLSKIGYTSSRSCGARIRVFGTIDNARELFETYEKVSF